MSSCSSGAVLLLNAIARECTIIADDIASLGAKVSSGAADAIALQSFDFLAQHVQAQALLIMHLVHTNGETFTSRDTTDVITRIPLPSVRTRLLQAVTGSAPMMQDDETVLWIEG